jgi:hypothetical protein
MAFPVKKKPDFLDEVVDDVGEAGSKDYGAEMSDDGDGMDNESGSEEAQQDRLMAVKQVARALGTPNADTTKLDQALHAYVTACMSMH